VRLGAQHPVESGRGHLQRVRARNRVLDVEKRGDLAAHLGAVIERDAGFPIDEKPHHGMCATGRVFQLDQLVTQTLE
jgi:hypothetical protein